MVSVSRRAALPEGPAPRRPARSTLAPAELWDRRAPGSPTGNPRRDHPGGPLVRHSNRTQWPFPSAPEASLRATRQLRRGNRSPRATREPVQTETRVLTTQRALGCRERLFAPRSTALAGNGTRSRRASPPRGPTYCGFPKAAQVSSSGSPSRVRPCTG